MPDIGTAPVVPEHSELMQLQQEVVKLRRKNCQLKDRLRNQNSLLKEVMSVELLRQAVVRLCPGLAYWDKSHGAPARRKKKQKKNKRN